MLTDDEMTEAIAGLNNAAGTDEFEIDIDVHPYGTSGNLVAAAEQDNMRKEAIRRGERVAYFYTRAWTQDHAGWRLWFKASVVTREQALQLLAAGARWIGREDQRPV